MVKFSGRTLAIAAVAGGAVLASVAPVMADVSAQSPSQSAVRVQSPAKLKAWGAVAEVEVTYACPQYASSAYLYVYVNQNVWGRIASGSGSKSVTCTGGFETVKVNVAAQNLAFWPADAFARADLNAYPGATSDERVIKLEY